MASTAAGHPFLAIEVTMTARARAYLLVAAARHLALAVVLLVAGDAFTSVSLSQIRAVMSLDWWAGMFLASAALCGVASARNSEALARVALIFSAVTAIAWTGGFLGAATAGHLNNPALPIVFAAIAAKDLIVCAQPLRSPFERLADQMFEHDR